MLRRKKKSAIDIKEKGKLQEKERKGNKNEKMRQKRNRVEK